MRNQLGFPVGLRPAFHPNHPLSVGITTTHGLVGVAQGATFVDLFTGKKGTAAATLTAKVDGMIGPGVVPSTGTAAITFTSMSTAIDTLCTIAAIVRTPATLTGSQFIFANDNTGGAGVGWYVNGSVLTFISANATYTFQTLTANVPYFIICSCNATTGWAVVLRLDSGVVSAVAATVSTSGVATAGNGTYTVGNDTGFGSAQFNGNIAALCFSPQYVGMAQGLAIARQPWAIWYQSPAAQIMSAGAPPGTVQHPLTLTVTTTSSISVLKSIAKALAVATTSTVALIRAVGKGPALASNSSVALARAVGEVLAVTSASAVSATTPVIRGVTLSVSSSSAVAHLLGVGKALAVNSVSAVSRIIAVAKTLSISTAGAVSIIALKVHLLSLAVSTSSAVSHILSVGKMLAISAASTVGETNSVGKLLAISTASSVSAIKAVGKILAVSTASAVSATAIKVHVVLVAVATASAVILSRAMSKQLAIASLSSISATRAATQHLTLTSASSVLAVKIAGKILALASASTVSAIVSKAHTVLASIASASTVLLARASAKFVPVSVTSTVVHVTTLAKQILIATSSAVATLPAALHHLLVSLTTASSVSATAIFHRFTASASTAFKFIARAVQPDPIVGSSLVTVHDPLTFICGDSWELTGPLQDSNGVALPLTSTTITWKLDDLYRNNIATLTVGSGITVLDVPSATILVELSATATAAIQPGNYTDWLRVVLVDGSVLTEWTGVIRAQIGPV